jgi:outer membrane biosynthesis protein TonB
VGLFGSLALHGAVVIATLFTVSHTLDIADQSPPVVPVDLVTVAQKTNIRATAHRVPKIAPTPVPPMPKAMPTPPVPQPQAEPQPEPPKQAEAEPLPKAPAPRPPPRLKTKPEQDEQKKTFDVDKVLALLNKVAPSQAAAPDAPDAPHTVRGFGAQNAMTADLVDALRSQIQPCWSPPVGAPHPERLIVTVDLFLNPDGSVAQPPQLLANSSDPYFEAAKEAAVRAIYTCAPYKLPADRYAEWREIKPFIFDPRQMMGE